MFDNTDSSLSEYISKLLEVQSIIKKYHVGYENDERLFCGAIKGMLESLEDEYSYYIPATEKTGAMVDSHASQGNYSGIGVSTLMLANGKILVTEVFECSPAFESGMKRFDIISKIGGLPVENINYSEAIRAMKGKVGSFVLVELIRDGISIKLEIMRKSSIKQRVFSVLLPDCNSGLIRIADFIGNHKVQFESHLKKMLEGDGRVEGLIIDIRNNRGGYPDNMTPILNMFMPKGMMFSMKHRALEKEFRYYADDNFIDIPLVVLVNRFTASCAEIFASVLADGGRAKIVGEHTRGKGLAQEHFALGDDSVVSITVAESYSSCGVSLNKKIEPDILLEQPPDILLSQHAFYLSSCDLYISKAIEVLSKRGQ